MNLFKKPQPPPAPDLKTLLDRLLLAKKEIKSYRDWSKEEQETEDLLSKYFGGHTIQYGNLVFEIAKLRERRYGGGVTGSVIVTKIDKVIK